MGIESLTHTGAGVKTSPDTKEDWINWVSATATRNYVLNDPLLDWLNLYGPERGFKKDTELLGYDPRTDFTRFVMRKGVEFEDSVVSYLKTRIPVCTIATNPMRSRSLKAAEETFEAMCRGEPAISQAVLWDAENRTYGLADLLVRSDELFRLFPNSMTQEDSIFPAPDLGNKPWHYRVIDIKFTTLHFYAGGGVSDSVGSSWAYKVQLNIYNRALGRLQGYLAPESYLLGRGWEQKIKKQTIRSTSCMDRLGTVPQNYESRSKGTVDSITDEAISWIRRVRNEGQLWEVLPSPSVPELRPNMGSTTDHPWHRAKQQIGLELEDLTLLWQVGLKGRDKAHASNVTRWSDPSCVASTVGITGLKQAPTLDLMLEVNRSEGGPTVLPTKLSRSNADWREESPLEFFVDFETVSDLNDDFSQIPEKGSQPLIFMVGCGHMEAGEWKWSVFTTPRLTQSSEGEILDAWFAHMNQVKQRIDPHGAEPIVFHWSHAEVSTLETSFNSAMERHPANTWPIPRWYDFLKLVVREEPVVVKGALGFGLKSIASALYDLGLTETKWDSGPTDGLGAMVGAWWSELEAKRLDCSLIEVPMMQEIEKYNEVDCKAMMEIIQYLRKFK